MSASDNYMPNQTVTRTFESALDPNKIYAALCDASLLPRWAPAFADKVEALTANTYRLTKDGQLFSVELIANAVALTVDYIREMPGGIRGGAYIRTMPRPLGGSTTVMTVPLAPTATEESVGAVLAQELAALMQFAAKL